MITLIKNLKTNKFINYIFFAILTSCINVSAYMLFYNCILKNIILSNIFAYTISITLSFIINKKVVFKNNDNNYIIQILLYLLVKMIAFSVDSIVLIGIKEIFKIDNFIAKLIANASTTISNYTLNNKLVFKPKQI